MPYRVKTTLPNGEEHLHPQEFQSKNAAEDFLATKVPAPMIPQLIEQGLIEIIRESNLVDARGNPIQMEISDV